MSPSFVSALPVLVLGLVPVAFAVYCEVDLARARRVRHLPKGLWAIICVISVPLGGISYLILGRTRGGVP